MSTKSTIIPKNCLNSETLINLNPTVMARRDVRHLYDTDEKTVIQDCITRRSAAG